MYNRNKIQENILEIASLIRYKMENNLQANLIYRYDLINYFIDKNKYKSYLEIGTEWGTNVRKIKCSNKITIDPIKKYDKLTYNMTSDNAFKLINEKFDIIFIDGLHLEEQVDKDIENSLKKLNEGGIIILHDCNPQDEISGSDPQQRKYNWNGSVYKSIIKLRYTRQDLFISVIDIDQGCGIIIPNKHQPLYNKCSLDIALTWDYFDKNRIELLNIKNINELSTLH